MKSIMQVEIGFIKPLIGHQFEGLQSVVLINSSLTETIRCREKTQERKKTLSWKEKTQESKTLK